MIEQEAAQQKMLADQKLYAVIVEAFINPESAVQSVNIVVKKMAKMGQLITVNIFVQKTQQERRT